MRMNLNEKELIKELQKYVIVDPFPFVVDLKNSKNMYLATVEGRKIFDWTGLYGSKLIGYNHPGLYEKDYLERLQVAANNKMANPDFLTPECLDYYRLVYNLAPKCMKNSSKPLEVYIVNSGAEAVENMMKYFINLHHQKNKGKKGRDCKPKKRFIYFDQAFHGRTVFALNVTNLSNDPMATKDFNGIIPGNIRVKFPAIDSQKSDEENLLSAKSTLEELDYLMEKYKDEIAGVILEPIQGAGGQRLAAKEFYQGLSELCHKHEILWGVDEVQTSGGQCGAFFCVDLFDLPYPPNAVVSAKKMGNGVIYMLDSMKDLGVLDSTWGGTLADMVRFVQEWKIVEGEKLLNEVEPLTKLLVEGLSSLQKRFSKVIYNIRGLGLYQGFSIHEPYKKSDLIGRALENEDMLLLGAGTNSIRFRPPLTVNKDDIQLMLQKLERVLSSLN
jgi:L-lysine 6-transaminase